MNTKESIEFLDIIRKRIEDLNEAVRIQTKDGNWNYGPYMFGMANGLILAKACIAGTDPQYLEKPDVWLKDRKDPVELKVVTNVGGDKENDRTN